MADVTDKDVDAALAKLSRQQRSVLRHLWALYVDQVQAESVPGFPAGCRHADSFGVQYHTNGTASFRASMSRTIARLESRGLILRQNHASGSPGLGRSRDTAADPKPLRTTRVSFTALGKAAAKRLTSETV